MSLFNQILGAINNPDAEASPSQLSEIINTMTSLSQNYDANPKEVSSAMSLVGKYAKTALQEKRAEQGEGAVENLISEFGGTQNNNQVVSMLFSNPQLQSLLTDVESRTGISQNTIQQMLPTLVPLVLNFLKTGNSSGTSAGRNSVLASFLDSDGDGDFDMADAINLASKYIK